MTRTEDPRNDTGGDTMDERQEPRRERAASPLIDAAHAPGAKAVARVAAVLEFFHDHGEPARAIDVVRALGLAPSSASDLLKALVDIGYLDFDDVEKTYYPGLRAALVGQWLASAYPNLESVNELMAELCRETGETVVLFVQRLHQVRVLSLRASGRSHPHNIAEGTSLPVIGTAAGGAVLMMKSDRELERIARRTYRTRSCGGAVAEMSRRVSDFRRQGYAQSFREDIIPDNWAIALPVPVTTRRNTVVLGVGGPIERVKMNAGELAAFARDRIDRHFGSGS